MNKVIFFGLMITAVFLGTWAVQNAIAQPSLGVAMIPSGTSSEFNGDSGLNDVTSTATCPPNMIIIGGGLHEFNIQRGSSGSEYTLTTTINPSTNSVDVRITLQTQNVQGSMTAQATCMDFSPLFQVVGGIIIPTNNISLALASANIIAPWIGLGLVGIVAGMYYFKANKKPENS